MTTRIVAGTTYFATVFVEDEPWAVPVREVVGRLFKDDPERVVIEIDRGTVFINFQESLKHADYIRKAVKGAVQAVLPAEYAEYDVSVI